MQDRRREEGLATFFDSLLQLLLNAILLGDWQRTGGRRQITKTADRRFNLANTLKIRQLIKPSSQVFSKFDVSLCCFGVSAFTHEFKSHPKLQSIESPRAHLAIAKKIVLHICATAIFAQVFRRNVE